MADSKNRNQEIFLRLEKVMQEKAPYLNPNLTRRQLSKMLATNENYLYRALRSIRGEQYSDYINRYRLDYAVRLLIEMPEAKIETITTNSGFRVRQTFYRHFQARYGTTPHEYQRSKMQTSDEET